MRDAFIIETDIIALLLSGNEAKVSHLATKTNIFTAFNLWFFAAFRRRTRTKRWQKQNLDWRDGGRDDEQSD